MTLGGYSYAGNNPVTTSDPTGLWTDHVAADSNAYVSPQQAIKDASDVGPFKGHSHDSDVRGRNYHGGVSRVVHVGHGLDLIVHGDGSAEMSNGQVVPPGMNPDAFAVAYGNVWDKTQRGGKNELDRLIIGTCQSANVCPPDLTSSTIADMMNDVAQHDPNCNSACRGYQAMLASLGGVMIGAEGPGMHSGGFGGTLLNEGRAFSGEAGAGTRLSGPTGCNSFLGDTPVLMADRSTKPIGQLRPGDRVVATDPRSGRTTVETVTAHIVGHDTELTDVAVVDGDGIVSIIHTTPHHPIWDRTANAWVDASALDRYHQLYIESGSTLTVLAVHSFVGSQRMYNLTVETVHTYYVLAGTTSVLVHNSNLCDIHGNPIDEGEPLYGPFHRLQSPTQGPEVAQQIVESGELWGKAPRVGLTNVPQAQAHLGPLPEGRAGVEFYTRVPPGPPYPGQARWLAGSPGVREEDGYAKISIFVTRNTQ